MEPAEVRLDPADEVERGGDVPSLEGEAVVAAAALFVVTRTRRGHAGGRRGGGGADEKTAFVAAANDYGASGSWA